MNKIILSDKEIGAGMPVFIVAEGADAHLGDLEVAKEMARQAKIANADAIKFQHHLPDEEMLPDTPMSDNMSEPLYDFLLKNALSLDQHIELKNFCDEICIKYMCTPFSFKAAEELFENNLIDIIKIGSGEMTDIPSLLKMSDFGLPMIISTGMCSYDEIAETYDALLEKNTQLALLNCVSEYPPDYEDINLKVISKMQSMFPKAIIGHSDHTPTIYTCFGAVTLGAKIIEKHVILDKQVPGPDQSVSIDFDELNDLVSGIRLMEVALGDEKKIHQKEKQIREWAFRSIVAKTMIKKDTVITQDLIWSKRPGTGIPSKQMDKVLGKVAKKNILPNTLLTWDDLE